MSVKTYDFIFSLGAACSCTQALRQADFQHASYPFDWLFGAQLPTRIDLMIHNFEHFIDLPSLSYVGQTVSIKCDTYYNKDNDITFNHDFLTSVPLAQSYPEVMKKYQRRINRLFTKIAQSSRVLAVYTELPSSSRQVADPVLIKSLEKLQQKYPAQQIDLCYIAADTHLPRQTFHSQQLTPHILKITANYTSGIPNQPAHVADIFFLSQLLRRFYKLNLPFLFRFKRFCTKCAIQWFVFNSDTRKKLRKRYHITA